MVTFAPEISTRIFAPSVTCAHDESTERDRTSLNCRHNMESLDLLLTDMVQHRKMIVYLYLDLEGEGRMLELQGMLG